MELLNPLGFFEIARALVFFICALYAPGFLFLRIQNKFKKKDESSGELFEGLLENFAGSILLSVLITTFVFLAVVFSVGLDFFSGAIGIAVVLAIEGYLLWKRKA